MWRYLNNVREPPPKKRKLGTTQYEENRVRQFQQTWLTKFQWLRYDSEKQLMFCELCERHGDSELNFVKGCGSLRMESLKMHDQSKVHCRSVQASEAEIAASGTTPVEKAIQNLNSKACDKLKILFRTCHALAKHCRPFTDYVWMCNLDLKKGLEIGQTYLTDVKCREFTDAIGEIERQKLKDLIKGSKFISIICDEATDSAVMEQLIIYVRYANGGHTRTDFLAIHTLERATSQNVFDGILNTFKDYLGIEQTALWSKLVGFASDGAAVMRGVRNGVSQKLKAHQPKLQAQHCIAHRLELAIKAAVKQVSIYEKLDKLLLDLYLFYHQSPLNRGLLRRTATALGIKKFIPTRTGGTRWVGHTKRALENLLSGYPAIVQHMLEIKDDSKTSNDSKGKCSGFLKKLMSREMLEFGHFLLDVINILSRLSAKFQERDLTVGQIPKLIADTLSCLKKLLTRPGPNMRKLQVDEGTSFHGMELTGMAADIGDMIKCVEALAETIEGRFPTDENSGISIMDISTILDLNVWPEEYDEEYGDREMAAVVDYYTPLLENYDIPADNIEVEWSVLRRSIYTDYHPVNKSNWTELGKRYRGEFPSLMTLVDLLLSLPTHSVECERGFSLMKKIKTDTRSTLTTDALTCVMRISLQSADEDSFDPVPAITYWNSLGQRRRRPFQPPYRKRTEIECDEIISDEEML